MRLWRLEFEEHDADCYGFGLGDLGTTEAGAVGGGNKVTSDSGTCITFWVTSRVGDKRG